MNPFGVQGLLLNSAVVVTKAKLLHGHNTEYSSLILCILAIVYSHREEGRLSSMIFLLCDSPG